MPSSLQMSPGTIEGVLQSIVRREPIETPVACVVAHPDDETVGARTVLHPFRRLTLLHVTDGAPLDGRDAGTAGFARHADYAAARQRELRMAMAIGQVRFTSPALDLLPIADQTALFRLAWLAQTLSDALQNVSVVLTHAYEGGHPDHNAVAFAVQNAGIPAIEMTGYHAAPDGGIETGVFLGSGETVIVELTQEERARRDAMLDCFATQRATLAPFVIQNEHRFRAAPRYDFAKPPAPRCYYDMFGWGISSAERCERAAQALRC